MKKWALIIDVEKCGDCNNCFLACKDEHVDNDWKGYAVAQPRHGQRWMNIHRKERGQCPAVDVAYLPVPCMHCGSAPCLGAGKAGAVYKREDGIVLIDAEKAKGQKDIVKSCPYDAIWWNEDKQAPQKCTFCAHLLDTGWKEPRCVQACPTGAMQVQYLEEADLKKIVESEHLEVLHPEYKTDPNVYYKNLYRFFSCFIAGTVAFSKDGIMDCAEGAEVALFKDSSKIAQVFTDNYGDFKFDKLEENSGKYDIEVSFRDHGKRVLQMDLTKSAYLGTIEM